MTKLSDTQLVILSAACQRDDRLIVDLHHTVKGGAAKKVVGSMLGKGLVAEVPAGLEQPVWREDSYGQRYTLVATDAACSALGITADDAPQGADEAQAAAAAPPAPAKAKRAPKAPRKPREKKRDAMLELLKRPEGATVHEIAEAFGWQPHTTRAAISTQTRKAGLAVATEKVDGRGRVYRAA